MASSSNEQPPSRAQSLEDAPQAGPLPASPAPLPPDRSHVATEGRHPRSADLDLLATDALIRLLVEDQHAAVIAVERASAAIAELVELLCSRIAAGGRLIYLGAGTSGRLGVLDASECPPTFHSDPAQVVGVIAGGESALRRSSEGAEDDPAGAAAELGRLTIGPLDTLIGIAAGGTTPWVLGALELGKHRGATTVLLTCAPREQPASCDRLIILESGPEILTGSTRLKAGTATKIALNAITTGLFIRLGKCHDHLMVDLRATNAKLRDRAIRVLQTLQPGLGRADAATALERAEGSAKVAAVMLATGLSRVHAEARLAECRGQLRGAMESLDGDHGFRSRRE